VWAFKALRVVLRVASVETYFLLPLLVAGVSFVVAGAGAELASNRATGIVAGLALCGAFVYLKWDAGRFPVVPDKDEVIHVPMSLGPNGWPKAPPAPLASELIAKGSQWFRDREGRKVLLRGINVSGACKLPSKPLGWTHISGKSFYEWKDVSFVDRPFPLNEAREHLGRLRAWGLTVFRLLITWEAVEHAGPGEYDEDYLSYLKKLVDKCKEFGISVIIDAHQDVWSRWTGGDGAPAWTLLKVGFDLNKLDDSGAAVTQQNFGDPFPQMVWNSNNGRVAAGTMWTLFFAGNDFAPKTLIDGEPAQDYLQRHFCAMLGKVAETLKGCDNVLGFDLLNEPSVGFVGIKDMCDISDNQFYVGWRLDAWTAIEVGAGCTRKVDYFKEFLMYDGTRVVNSNNVCAWEAGPKSCVWHQNGVWRYDEATGTPELLKRNYFANNPRTGAAIDFMQDYAVPFWMQATKAVRAHMPETVIFTEPVLDMYNISHSDNPKLTLDQVGAGFVWAKHWYDGITLISKSFSKLLGLDAIRQIPVVGLSNMAASYGKSLTLFKKEASGLGPTGSPVLIGECGIPFDLGKRPFENWDEVTCALNTTMRSLEHALVSYTLWNYCPDNSNSRGDHWNGEDLSVYSQDQIEGNENDLFTGGRGLHALIRPFPMRIAGEPKFIEFDPYRKDRRFLFSFTADHTLVTRESILYLPRYHYPYGATVSLSGRGESKIDWANQTLTIVHDPSIKDQRVRVTKLERLNPQESTTDVGFSLADKV